MPFHLVFSGFRRPDRDRLALLFVTLPDREPRRIVGTDVELEFRPVRDFESAEVDLVAEDIRTAAGLNGRTVDRSAANGRHAPAAGLVIIRLAAVRNEHRIVRQRQPSAGLAIGHIDIFVHDGTLFIGFEAASLRADAAFFRIRQNIN